VFIERTRVGLDVHARSVAAAGIYGVTSEVVQARLNPSHDQIRDWLKGLLGPGAVTYEASPTGFGLYRSLMPWHQAGRAPHRQDVVEWSSAPTMDQAAMFGCPGWPALGVRSRHV